MPILLLPKVEKQLDNLTEDEIIGKRNRANRLICAYGVVPKPSGDVRTTTDFTKLNSLKTATVLEGLEGVLNLMDVIFIFGFTQEKDGERLYKVLQCLEEAGVILILINASL